jgi:hypothetical protein
MNLRKTTQFFVGGQKNLEVRRRIANQENEKRCLQQAECSAIRFPINRLSYRPDLRQNFRPSFL